MSKTFLVEDQAGNFAYIEWKDNNLPFNVMTTAPTIFNCSTGEFVKNKNNRGEDDLPKESPSARSFGEWCEFSNQHEVLGFEVLGGSFRVTMEAKLAEIEEPEPKLVVKVLKERPAGDFRIRFDSDAFCKWWNKGISDSIEGTRTGRISSYLAENGQGKSRLHREGPKRQVVVHTYTPGSVPPSYQARMDALIKVANESTRKKEDEDPS